MALTRYRLTSDATAPAVTPAIQTYTHTQTTRRKLLTSDASALTSSAYTPDAADHGVAGDAHHIQFVSDPLAAGLVFDAGNTLQACIQGFEPNANCNQTLQLFASIVNSSGVEQAVIRSKVNFATELATALTARFLSTTLSGTYTTSLNDRIVVEISTSGTPAGGGGVQGHNATLRWGSDGAGGDLAAADGETGTTLNPWVEIETTDAPVTGDGLGSASAYGTATNPRTAKAAAALGRAVASATAQATICGQAGWSGDGNTATYQAGPFRAANGALYLFGRRRSSPESNILIFKSIDDGACWTQVGEIAAIAGTDVARHLTVRPDPSGVIMHIAWVAIETTPNDYVLLYAAWDTSDDTVEHAVEEASRELTSNIGGTPPCTIGIDLRDDGEVVIAATKALDATVFWRTTGGVWSETTLDSSVNWGSSALIVDGDIAHLFYNKTTSPGGISHWVLRADHTASAEDVVASSSSPLGIGNLLTAVYGQGRIFLTRHTPGSVAPGGVSTWHSSGPLAEDLTWTQTDFSQDAMDTPLTWGIPMVKADGGHVVVAWIRESDQALQYRAWNRATNDWDAITTTGDTQTVEGSWLHFSATADAADTDIDLWIVHQQSAATDTNYRGRKNGLGPKKKDSRFVAPLASGSASGSAAATAQSPLSALGSLSASGSAQAMVIHSATADGSASPAGIAAGRIALAPAPASGAASASGEAQGETIRTASASGAASPSASASGLLVHPSAASGAASPSGTAEASIAGTISGSGSGSPSGQAQATVIVRATASGRASPSGGAVSVAILVAVGSASPHGQVLALILIRAAAAGRASASGQAQGAVAVLGFVSSLTVTLRGPTATADLIGGSATATLTP